MGKKRILVVEDNRSVRDVLSRLLSFFDYAPIEAESAEQAIRLLTESRQAVDLVILDWTLPGLSGADAYREIRILLPATPVIVCSGLREGVVGQAPDDTAGFLHKPFTPEELRGALRRLLGP